MARKGYVGNGKGVHETGTRKGYLGGGAGVHETTAAAPPSGLTIPIASYHYNHNVGSKL